MSHCHATGILIDAINRAQRFITKDLDALSDEQLTKTYGGCTRTPLAILAELSGSTLWCAGKLSGCDAAFTEEDRAAYGAQFATREQSMALFADATNKLCAAIGDLTEDHFNDPIEGPMGPMPKIAMAVLSLNHMSYHDGQFNYIQTLEGDAKMHWMD